MKHVLVVEDDPQIGELVRDALVGRGLGAELVHSDIAAYRRIPSFPRLDAVILDVNLGAGTTGFDVARFARQVIPEVAVFYVTGDARENSFRAHGVPDSEFIEKPFRPDELVSAVARKVFVDPA